MPPVLWTETYRIGHPAIDHHHRELVECLVAVQTAIDVQASMAEILGRFDFWLDAFACHAQLEERLMDRLALPPGIGHREIHCAEHGDFLHEAMALRTRLKTGHCPSSIIENLGLNLIGFDLIRRDFEMIGLLLREGLVLEDWQGLATKHPTGEST